MFHSVIQKKIKMALFWDTVYNCNAGSRPELNKNPVQLAHAPLFCIKVFLMQMEHHRY